MTGNCSDKQSLKSQVGIGSRLHDFDADDRIIFYISSFAAGFSDPRIDITLVSSHWLSVLMFWHNPLRISNQDPIKVWDEIIYLLPNFNSCTVKIGE